MSSPAPVWPTAVQPDPSLPRSVHELVASDEVRSKIRCHISCEIQRIGLAWRRGRIEDLASDYLNQVLLRALERSSMYRPECGGVAWLKRIATTTLLNDLKRARHRASPVNAEVSLDALASPSPPVPDEDIDELNEAIARLDPRDQLALRCRYVLGLHGAALADALGVRTTKAATDLLYRAMKALRARMGDVPRASHLRPSVRRGARARGVG